MLKLCKPSFIISAIIVVAFAVQSAAASAVSFQLIQHDSVQSDVRIASSVIENEFFDYFFDRGHVATNFPIAVSSSEEVDEDICCSSMDEARKARCKYLIVVKINYDIKASPNREMLLLSTINNATWEVYDTESEQKIDSSKLDVGNVPYRRDNEQGIRNFARQLAVNMDKVFKKQW